MDSTATCSKTCSNSHFSTSLLLPALKNEVSSEGFCAGSGLSPGSCDPKSDPLPPGSTGNRTSPHPCCCSQGVPNLRPRMEASQQAAPTPELQASPCDVSGTVLFTGPRRQRMPAAPRPRTQHVLMGLSVLRESLLAEQRKTDQRMTQAQLLVLKSLVFEGCGDVFG